MLHLLDHVVLDQLKHQFSLLLLLQLLRITV